MSNKAPGCIKEGSSIIFNEYPSGLECGTSSADCVCKITDDGKRYDNKKIPSSVACEKNNQYDVEDMTKEECLAFRSFESSTGVSDSDASGRLRRWLRV